MIELLSFNIYYIKINKYSINNFLFKLYINKYNTIYLSVITKYLPIVTKLIFCVDYRYTYK